MMSHQSWYMRFGVSYIPDSDPQNYLITQIQQDASIEARYIVSLCFMTLPRFRCQD